MHLRLSIIDTQRSNALMHYTECHYADCHYAECHYAECHYADCRGTVLFYYIRIIV